MTASYDSRRKANRLESAPALSAPTVVLDQYNRRLPQEIADIYISTSMETFEHRKYKIRGENGNN